MDRNKRNDKVIPVSIYAVITINNTEKTTPCITIHAKHLNILKENTIKITMKIMSL